MADNFTFRIEGMANLKAQMQRLTVMGRYVLTPLVAKYALRIQSTARRLVRVDTGLTRSSIITAFMGQGLTAEIGTNKAHARALEEGSRPHMPPVDALRGWAKRHGMKPGAEWAIARAIAKRGTRPRPFMMPAWDQHAPDFLKDAVAALKDGAQRLTR